MPCFPPLLRSRAAVPTTIRCEKRIAVMLGRLKGRFARKTATDDNDPSSSNIEAQDPPPSLDMPEMALDAGGSSVSLLTSFGELIGGEARDQVKAWHVAAATPDEEQMVQPLLGDIQDASSSSPSGATAAATAAAVVDSAAGSSDLGFGEEGAELLMSFYASDMAVSVMHAGSDDAEVGEMRGRTTERWTRRCIARTHDRKDVGFSCNNVKRVYTTKSGRSIGLVE